MKIYFGALLTWALLSGVTPWETASSVQDCGSPLATLTKLVITPPCQPDACVLKRGERITLSAEFVPKVYSKDLLINGYSKDPVFGFETFLFKESICSPQFNISCPFEANKPVSVYFSEIISDKTPPNRFVIKMILTGDSGKRFMCQTTNMEVR